MDVNDEIDSYIASQPDAKAGEMRELHRGILQIQPGCELWFLDGRNSENKVVSNPNIGYGTRTITSADGSTKDFYRVGISANTSGISVYILGLADKQYLSETYGATIGKAKVSGYCIKFKTLQDVDMDVLESAIRVGLEAAPL
jgi:hypothetical protein